MKIRTAIFGALVTLLICLGTVRSMGEAPNANAPIAESVVRIGMTVEDLDRSTKFFVDVLNFEKVGERELAGPNFEKLTGLFGSRARVAVLRLGSEEIELTEFLTGSGREVPRDSRSNDHWFQHIAIITSDMEKAYARLRKHNIKHASSGPQRLPDSNPNAGGIRAFYFKDPDRHVIEVLQFPPDKGQQRWQDKGRLFLGIDHTAIVVSETEKSLDFYREKLGMTVIGKSENAGDEQEHLNGIFGARLRITTLSTGHGPAIELLEYLAPTDGRPYPMNARVDDLFHWQTTISTHRFNDLFTAAQTQRRTLISTDIAPVPSQTKDSIRAFILRDPDGHAIQFQGQ